MPEAETLEKYHDSTSGVGVGGVLQTFNARRKQIFLKEQKTVVGR